MSTATHRMHPPGRRRQCRRGVPRGCRRGCIRVQRPLLHRFYCFCRFTRLRTDLIYRTVIYRTVIYVSFTPFLRQFYTVFISFTPFPACLHRFPHVYTVSACLRLFPHAYAWFIYRTLLLFTHAVIIYARGVIYFWFIYWAREYRGTSSWLR